MNLFAALVALSVAVAAHHARGGRSHQEARNHRPHFDHPRVRNPSGHIVEGLVFGDVGTVKNQKALKALLEAQMRDESIEPLIFTAVGFKEGHGMSILLNTGTTLKMRSGVAETLTTFVRDTVVDKVLELEAPIDEGISPDETQEEETGLELAILSDVPSLMHRQMGLEATTPLGMQIKKIEQTLIQRLAHFSVAEVKKENTPSKWRDHQFHADCECCKILMLEGMALRELEQALKSAQLPAGVESPVPQHESKILVDVSSGLSTNSVSGVPNLEKKPVVLVALNQAVACFIDHKDTEKAVEAIELLHKADLPGIKVIVPVQHHASLRSAMRMAEHCSNPGAENATAAVRRLQAESPSDTGPMVHMGDLDFAAANPLYWAEPPQRDLQQIGQKQKAINRKVGGKLTGTDLMTFWVFEKRQITLWIAVGLAAAAIMTVWGTIYMPLNKDPLLYTKIYTGGAVAHQA